VNIFVLALVSVGFTVLYAWFGVTLGRRLMHGRVREGHNDVLAPIFLTAGTLYAVLLAFLVIAVWESYGEVKVNVAAEASALTTLYREANGLPDREQRQLRALLREYTEAVAGDEWRIQAEGRGASPRARKAIGSIYRSFHTMDPKVANSAVGAAFLQTLQTVATDRDTRRFQSSEELPAVLWVGLVLGGLVVISMTFVLYMESTLPHVLFSVMMAALIGLMLFIAMILNRPFAGPLAIAPEPFEHALSVFDSVDKGY
jgi:hypothetical protein